MEVVEEVEESRVRYVCIWREYRAGYLLVYHQDGFFLCCTWETRSGRRKERGGRLTHFSLRAFKTVVRYLVFISEKERERERERRSARK